MKSRDRRAERMSEFMTNMFQYNVTVGIARSEVICVKTHVRSRKHVIPQKPQMYACRPLSSHQKMSKELRSIRVTDLPFNCLSGNATLGRWTNRHSQQIHALAVNWAIFFPKFRECFGFFRFFLVLSKGLTLGFPKAVWSPIRTYRATRPSRRPPRPRSADFGRRAGPLIVAAILG